ncbi:MAG: hypothetical protein UX91_C0006G0079 [Candidatus Amesbacteria bacterium GW2011_GWB1_47_19]|nr:MAG: hypothetical protein UW51_C0002G0080 [Candidatus Amesbacteria bacterium GW2011_GWA1_44_24]KKU31330.1 MAG: hypothetical protein UX46_C0006G0122 [Candidatus Amesbacteria bacterium GW2011_GWC1_46_24]KKU67017.1 MAG: hypothetical protein UX91_C0006G0079 [Candidatus Amesbacteria bacterium GW2011_GWB1_47_19]
MISQQSFRLLCLTTTSAVNNSRWVAEAITWPLFRTTMEAVSIEVTDTKKINSDIPTRIFIFTGSL